MRKLRTAAHHRLDTIFASQEAMAVPEAVLHGRPPVPDTCEDDVPDLTPSGRLRSYLKLLRLHDGREDVWYRTSQLPRDRISAGYSTHLTWKARLKRARKRHDLKALARLYAQGDCAQPHAGERQHYRNFAVKMWLRSKGAGCIEEWVR